MGFWQEPSNINLYLLNNGIGEQWEAWVKTILIPKKILAMSILNWQTIYD